MAHDIPLIKSTTDYRKFHFLKENRPINRYKVARIKKSILEDDQTPWRPILVDKTFGIIDGQHQFTATKELKKPIYYTQNVNAKLRTIALLNAFTTNWSMENFLDFYAKQGIESYIEVQKFAKKYHLSTSLAICALTMTFHSMGNIRNNFKEGTYLISHMDEATKLMDEIMTIRPHVLENVLANREFYRSYTIMRQQIEFDVFFNTLQTHALKIEPRGRKKEYLRQFEDILNFKKSKNLVRLY